MYINDSTHTFQTGAMRRCLFGSEVYIYIVSPSQVVSPRSPANALGRMWRQSDVIRLQLFRAGTLCHLTSPFFPHAHLSDLFVFTLNRTVEFNYLTPSQKQQQNFWPSHVSLVHDAFDFWLHCLEFTAFEDPNLLVLVVF